MTAGRFAEYLARLECWTVYDHPLDAPAVYRARRFVLEGSVQPTWDVMDEFDLETLRRRLRRLGLHRIERCESDDPVILEIWL